MQKKYQDILKEDNLLHQQGSYRIIAKKTDQDIHEKSKHPWIEERIGCLLDRFYCFSVLIEQDTPLI